mmetsp:Transcript_12969/g.48074  ORF Transcript_12969/g.48074 Transcript_12969/m.48074 type:complete len:262 (-) Transcript_12969:531-1316(-)
MSLHRAAAGVRGEGRQLPDEHAQGRVRPLRAHHADHPQHRRRAQRSGGAQAADSTAAGAQVPAPAQDRAPGHQAGEHPRVPQQGRAGAAGQALRLRQCQVVGQRQARQLLRGPQPGGPGPRHRGVQQPRDPRVQLEQALRRAVGPVVLGRGAVRDAGRVHAVHGRQPDAAAAAGRARRRHRLRRPRPRQVLAQHLRGCQGLGAGLPDPRAAEANIHQPRNEASVATRGSGGVPQAGDVPRRRGRGAPESLQPALSVRPALL